jgi:outer membrane protein TolC
MERIGRGRRRRSLIGTLADRLKAYFEFLMKGPGSKEQLQRAEETLAWMRENVSIQRTRVAALQAQGLDTQSEETVLESLKETEAAQQERVQTLKKGS